ncbi:IS110 family transposase [Oscillospiraceae bacterium CM]|nr:IS110 family transposase [Oscillospiraceae bacterium CM]
MTAVGVDVSKGKSTVAIRRPGGEIVMTPITVLHTAEGPDKLIDTLRSVEGEIRIVMEHTGMYWRPIALALKNAGFFVSVVNAMLIHDFSDNSIRKVKTDRADSLKIANYALTFWQELRDYSIEDENRQMLKIQSRLYERTLNSSVALRNGLISLLDQVFPGANKLFDEQRTKSGHIKWVDFVRRFWNKDCVAASSFSSFADTFQKWCKRTGYHFSLSDAERIHGIARNSVDMLTKNDSTKLLITQAVDSLNAVYDTLQILRNEMYRLASLLPEFEIVMSMQGAGKITGPQLMAEIGDVRRFTSKSALVAFAGVDAPPYQSGTFDSKSRHVSKRGSPHLRRALFTICSVVLQHADPENPIYQFMNRKRVEGKHFYVYTVAGGAKFLRIYYARVKEYLNALDAQADIVA